MEESGKSKVGGVCFMTNNKWCNPKDIMLLLFADPGASDDLLPFILSSPGVQYGHHYSHLHPTPRGH